MEQPPQRVSSSPFRLPVSLRTRLIAANVLIIFISIAALGSYVFYRGQQTNEYLSSELDANIRQKAIDRLTAISERQAETLNSFFASLRNDIANIGLTTEALLGNETQLSGAGYWKASETLVRIENGSWDNPSTTEPASVFMPASQELTDSLAAEISTLRQLDFVAPNLLHQNPDVVAVYFGGASGDTIYYPNVDLARLVPPDFDVTQRPWYVAASPAQDPSRKVVWSIPYLDAASHGLVITGSYPIYDPSTGFRGVVAVDVQLNRMSQLVAGIHVAESGYAFMLDGAGRLIAMPDAAYRDLGVSAQDVPLGQAFSQDKLPTPISPELLAAISRMRLWQSGLETVHINGQERFIIYRPLPEVGYNLAIIVPADEMLTGAKEAKQKISMAATDTQQISLVIVTIILGMGLLMTLAVGNTLIAPLLALTQTAHEIARGNLEAHAEVRGSDEIATLGHALNSMTTRLRDLIQSLESRVRDRTAALEAASQTAGRRAAQFEAVTQVTRAIGSIRNMDELMPLVAAVISQYFDFYHIGIFLNDDLNEYAWLIAANSAGGRRMLERRHRLKIGEQGLVGYVAARGESRVARSVGEDAVFFNNPDLPETKSEAALPLRRGNQVAGVLDVQSTREDAFSADDLQILAVLADQVGLAIENTHLFETTRRSLLEAETLYRQYVQEAWKRLPQEGEVTGYRYTPRGAAPLSGPTSDAGLGETPGQTGGEHGTPPLVVPIRLRGETIGNLVLRSHQAGTWTQEQIELAEAVADRVAFSAENARLFDETSRRAERERLVTEITSRIRSSNDPDEMIRTAVEELRNALGATEIQVIPQTVPPSGSASEKFGPSAPPEPGNGTQRGNGAKR